MAKTKPEPETRRHEHEFEIEASPEAVWKAITDARELVNWFPLEAEVEPGPGGSITYGWGEELTGTCGIVTWEPPKRLRTSWMEHGTPEGSAGAQIAVDWFVTGESGRTRLRLVHSGFGKGPEWDEEYNGTRRGWQYELRSLKHYLEHHRGQRRTTLLIRQAVPFDAGEAWKRVVRPEGLLRGLDAAKLQSGNPVRLSIGGEEEVEGKVLTSAPPEELSFSVDNLDRSLFRYAFESCFGRPEAQLWVSLWAFPEDRAASLKRRLEQALASAVG